MKLGERFKPFLLSMPGHLEDLHDLQAVLVVGGGMSVLDIFLQHLEFI